MRAIFLSVNHDAPSASWRARLLRQATIIGAASLYLTIGAMLYILATTIATAAADVLAPFGLDVWSAGAYLPALLAWIALLVPFAELTAGIPHQAARRSV